MWTTPHGHGYMGDYHDDDPPGRRAGQSGVRRIPRKDSSSESGEKEADRILRVTLWNTIVYPNCSFMSQFRQLRIIHPRRGRPLGGLHLLVPHEGRAGADVPRHRGVRQRGERHRLLGADRRPRGLRAHPARPVVGRGGLGLHRPRLRPRRRGARRRSGAARPAPARSSSARRFAAWLRLHVRNERRAVSVPRGAAAGHAAARGLARALHRRRDLLGSAGARARRTRSRPARSSTTTARCSSCG